MLDLLRTRLGEGGMERYADDLIALARPSVRLVAEPSPAGGVPIGGLKLGGAPDVPRDLAWPSFRGVPQSFVAQVDLSVIAPFEGAGTLPRAGLLSFYYDAAQEAWGFAPEHRGGWAVLYTPADATLERAEPPANLPEDARFREVALAPRAELALPPYDAIELERVLPDTDDRFRFADAVREVLGDETGMKHRMLGYADPVQEDMRLECQLASSGIDIGGPEGYEDPRVAALEPGAEEWQLLLQVDSEDAAGMMWGDVGRIYYWLKASDLETRRFGEAWSMFQCS